MNNSRHDSLKPLYDASLPPLSKGQEQELALLAKKGDAKARETLIRSNIRFAIQYGKTFEKGCFEEDEIATEAIIGLIKAVDRFNPSQGTRLITYAKYFIRCEILTAKSKCGNGVHESDTRSRALIKINSAFAMTSDILDEDKRLEEISSITGLSKKLILELLEENQAVVSLDSPVTQDGSGSLMEMLEDPRTDNPEEKAIYEWEKEKLYSTLSRMDSQERKIICMFYGLGENQEPKSLVDIGKLYGCSRQQIFFLKEKALNLIKQELCA